MPVDATVDAIITRLAALELAQLGTSSSYGADGIKAVYETIPNKLDGLYPAIVHYRASEGSQFNQVTMAGGNGIGVRVAGSRERLHSLEAALLVGPRLLQAPLSINALEARVRPWIDRYDSFVCGNVTLGGIVLQISCLYSRAVVLTLDDGPHFGEVFRLLVSARPRVTFGDASIP